MTKPDFTEDRIYNDFPKMLGFIYGDIVGQMWACRVHLGFFQTKGDEFNKAASTRTSCASNCENGACHANEPPMPPAGEGAKAGAGDPARCASAVQRPTASKPGPRQRMKNKASMSLSKSLCARFEHSRARNKQF